MASSDPFGEGVARNIYHHHPESKKRKSSEANSGSIHPYGRYENAVKTRKTISTIAILRPVKAIFEKRAATVEVDSFVSPVKGGFGECALVPVFILGEHVNVPSFRFSFQGNMRMYPRSGFRSGGTSECTLVPAFVPEHPPKPPFWKTTLLETPEKEQGAGR